MRIRYLIQCHPVEFNGFVVLPHLVVNVAHVYSQSARVIKHSVLGNDLVGVECFCVHIIGCILIGQIEENLWGQAFVCKKGVTYSSKLYQEID